MVPVIERITEGHEVSEGPHWDADTQTLYFVDVHGKRLVRYNPATKKVTQVSVAPKLPSFIIPVEGRPNHFIISMDKELVLISWDGESDQIQIVESLWVADEASEIPGKRLNDAKCDSKGRLWTGTMKLSEDVLKSQPLGALYSFDSNRRLKKHFDKIRLTNGMAFNEQQGKMYYIDSLEETVDQFDFDVHTGTISNRRVFFTLKQHNVTGIPDGMTIDTDGNLWVAIFFGSRVLKIDGKRPETLLTTINMPAEQVTSVTFGGPKLDELYVTTGAVEFEGKKMLPPVNGATYRVTQTGSRGFPGLKFKLN